LIGVSDASFLETIAGALARLGVDRALVVAGEDGLDEVSISAATRVVEVNGAELSHYTLTPNDVGIELAAEPDYDGGTPEENAAVTRAILAGEPGQRTDLALINAGTAIYAAGVAQTIAEGVLAARAAIEDGRAESALERYLQASRRYAPAEAAR
jgi:anthranilate phosphoribosyltransferase